MVAGVLLVVNHSGMKCAGTKKRREITYGDKTYGVITYEIQATSYEMGDTSFEIRARTKIREIKSRLRRLMTVRYGTWTVE
jgi:hypothetical protein